MKKKRTGMPHIENRRARHDYDILDTTECGISLRGNEAKSLRTGAANLNGAWCSIENGQLILHNSYIAKYDTANVFDTEERRDRTLLAHKQEIRRMDARVRQDGITLVPLDIHWNRQYCKVTIGICKGRHNYDKRQALKERDQKRDMDRAGKY